MKFLLALAFLTLSAFAQAPKVTTAAPAAAPIAPDAVVAKVGGKPLTAADIRKMLAILPSDLQSALMQNPTSAIQSMYLLQYLSGEAEKTQLENKSPYKEQLGMQRMQLLAQARTATYSEQVEVSETDQQKRYESDKAKFDQAKIRAIFISFADPQTPAPIPEKGQEIKTRTEAEALTRAEGLVKQARAGSDFAELAKKNSDDKLTGAKGGEYGKISKGEKISEDVKNKVFALKAGGITDPIKQANGYFIIKVDELNAQPFKDVQPQILAEMKQERFQEWMQGLQKKFEVTVENPAFFPKKEASSGPSITAAPVN